MKRRRLAPGPKERVGYVWLQHKWWPAWKNRAWSRANMAGFDELPRHRKIELWHKGSKNAVAEEKRSEAIRLRKRKS